MWFFLSLITAIFTSLYAIVLKKALEYWPNFIIMTVEGFISAIILISFTKITVENWQLFFFALLVSTTVAFICSFLQMKAYESSELSLIFPLINFTPMFMWITSPLILKEYPDLISIPGIMAIVLGAYFLNFKDRRHGLLAPLRAIFHSSAARSMLLVAFLWSIAGNVDKLGVINSSPFLWGASIKFAVAILALPLAIRQRKQIKHQKTSSLFSKYAIILAPIFLVVIIISSFMAYEMTKVVYVITIKRLSSLFTILFGWLYLKEENIRNKFVGAIFMLFGVLWLAFI